MGKVKETMSEDIAVMEQQRLQAAKRCRHHWIIETPHGVTSRGFCKRCGVSKRFPNAAEDARWESARGLGRWSARRGRVKPAEVSLRDGGDKEER